MTTRATWLIASMACAARLASAQDGTDIKQAIPIYFDQVVTGIGDKVAMPVAVYSITLAKGQTVSLAANARNGDGNLAFRLLNSQAQTYASAPSSSVVRYDCCGASWTYSYLVPASGTYYIALTFNSSGTGYQLTVKSTGTPIAIPNPTTAGCLTGPVDYITYSLQRIAAGLPDELSIAGTAACATCAVKPPAYPEIASRVESALKSNIAVSACYDSGGNIFQIKLVRP